MAESVTFENRNEFDMILTKKANGLKILIFDLKTLIVNDNLFHRNRLYAIKIKALLERRDLFTLLEDLLSALVISLLPTIIGPFLDKYYSYCRIYLTNPSYITNMQ